MIRRPATEEELEEALSRPTSGVGEALARLGGDLVFLGAGGKIGPTMARMARRALDEAGSSARVIAVSRFSDGAVSDGLRAQGIEVVPADLADPGTYGSLPDAGGVFYLAAMKFGTQGNEHHTWWSNAAIPTLVSTRYQGVPTMVYSTGNVYPLQPLHRGGSLESDPMHPLGEYAQSCLARERLFTAAAERWGTPTTIFRLNYACEYRYGVIADLAAKIVAGEPVDVTMPAVNVVWQGDSSAWSLQSIGLAGVPPHVLNGTGPETVGVRKLATWLAETLETDAQFVGEEADTALLNDAGECFARYGYPTVPLRALVEWVAEWVAHGGRLHQKATKFQTRDGRF